MFTINVTIDDFMSVFDNLEKWKKQHHILSNNFTFFSISLCTCSFILLDIPPNVVYCVFENRVEFTNFIYA